VSRARLIRTLVLLAVMVAAFWLQSRESARTGSPAPPTDAGRDVVAEAFRERRGDVPVEVDGRVRRTLPDDREGSRHQRFILDLGDGLTVLVAHNIDLAPRVPLQPGDRVRVRGEYEWNDRGGVIHWTHHDPRGRRPGGWIRHAGELYE